MITGPFRASTIAEATVPLEILKAIQAQSPPNNYLVEDPNQRLYLFRAYLVVPISQYFAIIVPIDGPIV